MGKDITIGATGIVLLALAVFLAFYFKIEDKVSPGTEISTSTAYRVYVHTNPAFVVKYPSEFTLNDAHVYTVGGPGTEIQGVALRVPSSITSGTNLSADSYISVEWKNEPTCTTRSFLLASTTPRTITDNGTSYSVATSSGAGAGNVYEETVYVRGCLAVRYLIHSTNIGNYPEGTVRQFDRDEVLEAFDLIRRTVSETDSLAD